MHLIFPKHDSKKGVYGTSKAVGWGNWRKAARIGKEMYTWLKEKNGAFEGNFKSAFAISHCQVEADEPLQLFVLSPEMVSRWRKGGRVNSTNYYFPAPVIANMQILEKPETIMVRKPKRDVKMVERGKAEVTMTYQNVKESNIYAPDEGCMSFPNRTKKSVKRFYRIHVKYWYLSRMGIWLPRTEWVEGLKAHIIQHEVEHAQGKNMYYAH